MKTHRGVAIRRAGTLSVSLLALSSCSDLGSFNFRITVSIETPLGLRTGNSVISVRAYNIPIPENIGGGNKIAMHGDVPFVDLPSGVTVLAILADGLGGGGPLTTMLWQDRRPGVNANYQDVIEDLNNNPTCKAVPRERLPDLVLFENTADPNSVVRFKSSDIAKRLGRNYRVKGVQVCVTDETPVYRLQTRLPWIDKLRELKAVRKSIPSLRYKG